jgi:hypothetical protein
MHQRMDRLCFLTAFAVLCSCLGAPAQVAAADTNNPQPDKSEYSLFNPVPRELMRELTPDRPDKTEGPFTVDAGHYQLEMDFANFTQDQSEGVRTRTWNVAPFNFKVGLSDRVDFHLIYGDYFHVRTDDGPAHQTTTQSGFGDLTARVKINLWGDDGGSTAFGLLPFVKFPTSTGEVGNDSIEGGMILPFAVKLPAGWGMGLETAVTFQRNDADSGRHEEFLNSVTFDHDLFGKLGGYVEFFSDVSTERGSAWVGTVDLGLTYGVTENMQLDAGVNFGVTPAADDLNLFTGITLRF